MSRFITTLAMAALVLSTFFLSSCAEGPTGAEPSQELYLEYPGSLSGQTLTERKTGDMIFNGTTEPLQRAVTSSGRGFATSVEFQGAQTFNPLQKSTFTVYFSSANPQSSEWKTTDLSSGEPTLLTNGVRVRINAVNYYPVEGSTTIQGGWEENGKVGGAVGYFNGKLRAITGQEITVQSCVFRYPAP